MRVKSAVASFFLFFAGIILLAHTIIPHHHHEHTTIILLGSLLKPDCITYEQHSHERYCKSSDCEVPKDDCQGKNKICTDVNILLKNSEDSKEKLFAATNDIIPLLLLFSGDDNAEAHTDQLNSYLGYNTFVPLYHISYLPDSQGLRAPPAC